MDGKPKRRWLKFSVRTLLIAVTIFCVWLGWQVQIVHTRNRILAEITAAGGRVYGLPFTLRGYPNWNPAPQWNRRPLLALRCYFGDQAIAVLVLPRESFTDSDRDYMQSVFSESIVYFDEEAKDREHQWGPNSRREGW